MENLSVLVLGGNGFIGYSVICELVKRGIRTKSLDLNAPEEKEKFSQVEYFTGDIWDIELLNKAMNGVDCVMDFVSMSMPNTNVISLGNEINNTLRYHDYILSTMHTNHICRYVFPSSGGAIYGNKEKGIAYESDELKPSTPYGAGKKLTEEILRYYYDRCGISACVLRIGNVYGSLKIRSKAQGVVDVFVQNALLGEKITLWGNAERTIRDYVFLGDVASAVVDVLEKKPEGFTVYNVGSGIGTSLSQIIAYIEKHTGRRLQTEKKASMSSGIDTIVLSSEKIYNEIGWAFTVPIEEGIIRTIEIKKKLLDL